MPSNVRVAVRVRPMLDHEITCGHKQKVMTVDARNSEIA